MKNFLSYIVPAVIVILLSSTGCTGKSPEQQLGSAKDYLQRNDSKSAIIQLKNALQKNPNLAEARFLLGQILLDDGNGSGAEIEFRKALAAKHPSSLVIPELARAMLTTDQATKLVDEFGSTKFGKPIADANFQTKLVTAYSLLGKPEQAKLALNAALNAAPSPVTSLIRALRFE